MTGPIQLLSALLGGETQAQPAPADDAAQFTAALVAAMQAAMIPVAAPQAPPVSTTPTPQGEEQRQSAEAEGEAEQPTGTATADAAKAGSAEQAGTVATPTASAPAIPLPQHLRLGATITRGERKARGSEPAPETGRSAAPESAKAPATEPTASATGTAARTESASILPDTTAADVASLPGAASAPGVTSPVVEEAAPAAQSDTPLQDGERQAGTGERVLRGGETAPAQGPTTGGLTPATPDKPMATPVEPRRLVPRPAEASQHTSVNAAHDVMDPSVPAAPKRPESTTAAIAQDTAPSPRQEAEVDTRADAADADAATVSRRWPTPREVGSRPETTPMRRRGDRPAEKSVRSDAAPAETVVAMPPTVAAVPIVKTPDPMRPSEVADRSEAPDEQAPSASGSAQDKTVAPETAAPTGANSGAARDAASAPAQGLGFMRRLAEILGDAEISDVRVTLGRRPAQRREPEADEDAAAPPDREPVAVRGAAPEPTSERAANTPAAPISQAGAAPTKESAERSAAAEAAAAPSPSPTPRDDDTVSVSTTARPAPRIDTTVAGPKDPTVSERPVARSRSAVKERVADSTTAHEVPHTIERTEPTVRVRVAAAPQGRNAPDELPATAPRSARPGDAGRVPNLPETRQEIPAEPVVDDRTANAAPREERTERSAPSDSAGRASVGASGSDLSANRSEPRTREGAAGEARNMPLAAETKSRPAGLADRVTLQVADGDGRQTRIRVSVQGDQVRAVILPGDQESSRHLEQRMDDLQAALVRQGFVDPKVSVQTAGRGAGEGTPWGAAPGGPATEQGASRGMDRPAEDQGQGAGRREQDRHGDGQRHPQQRFRHRDPDDRQNQDA